MTTDQAIAIVRPELNLARTRADFYAEEARDRKLNNDIAAAQHWRNVAEALALVIEIAEAAK